ncbi:uncharacterized protein [Linepithema humile]|uniref:uncharacterized protein n=1 Tax=Linepithema humile TaxID=83485 RepID=UPI00351ED239
MVEWAAALGLCLLNTGSRSTCVRTRGVYHGSHVGFPVGRAQSHGYIVIEASTTPTGQLSRCRRNTRKSWVLKKINEDILMAVILVETWPTPSGQVVDLDEEATRISPSKAMYWWTEEIADLRRLSSAARRTFLRVRKRGDHTRMTEALEGFWTAPNALRAAIRKEKARAWEELTSTLDWDPWGRPFRLVLRKLRPRAPPTAEKLKPAILGNVIDTLFPVGEINIPPTTIGETARGTSSLNG